MNDNGTGKSPAGHLFIGLITYKPEVHYRVTESIERSMHGLAQMGWRFTRIVAPGHADLCDIRNTLFAECYANPTYTDMLFVDSDVFWEPGAVERLVSHPVDLVAGVYPRRADDAGYPIRTLPGPCMTVDPLTGEYKDDGIIQVAGLPTGLMRISRNCIEKMIAAYSDRWYAQPNVSTKKAWNVFEFNVADHERMGEDINFCRLWRNIGGTVWADPHLLLHHHGEKTFSGRLIEHMRKVGRLSDPTTVKLSMAKSAAAEHGNGIDHVGVS